MKLATNALLLEDIMLPKFYSVQFDLYMDAPEIDDGKIKLILGLTKGLGISGAGSHEPSFGIETNDLNFVTKTSSGEKTRHETPMTGEWYSKWLSFKIIRCLLVCMRSDLHQWKTLVAKRSKVFFLLKWSKPISLVLAKIFLTFKLWSKLCDTFYIFKYEFKNEIQKDDIQVTQVFE